MQIYLDNEIPVAHFDMDGSLFDYEEGMRRMLVKLASPDEPPIDEYVDLHQLEKENPHIDARMKLIKSVPGWWRNLAPLEDGFQIFRLAKEIGFHCKILTKGPLRNPIAWMEKLECCQMHLGEDIEVQIVTNKGETYGRVLYDDFPDYMDAWLKHRHRGLGIMPVTNHNKDYHHPQVVRWDGTNVDEVKSALQKAFSRNAKEALNLHS